MYKTSLCENILMLLTDGGIFFSVSVARKLLENRTSKKLKMSVLFVSHFQTKVKWMKCRAIRSPAVLALFRNLIISLFSCFLCLLNDHPKRHTAWDELEFIKKNWTISTISRGTFEIPAGWLNITMHRILWHRWFQNCYYSNNNSKNNFWETL